MFYHVACGDAGGEETDDDAGAGADAADDDDEHYWSDYFSYEGCFEFIRPDDDATDDTNGIFTLLDYTNTFMSERVSAPATLLVTFASDQMLVHTRLLLIMLHSDRSGTHTLAHCRDTSPGLSFRVGGLALVFNSFSFCDI